MYEISEAQAKLREQGISWYQTRQNKWELKRKTDLETPLATLDLKGDKWLPIVFSPSPGTLLYQGPISFREARAWAEEQACSLWCNQETAEVAK
jgi:hypothetical protein